MSNNNTRYTAQAVDHTLYEGENGKSPQIGVQLRVVEGPDTGKDLYWYGSLHEKAQQWTIEALRNMGWSCNDITELKGLGSLKVIAVEKPAAPYIDKNTGATKMGKAQWMIFPLKTPKPTLEADAKSSFAARFKALAAQVAPVAATALSAAGELPEALPKNGTGATVAATPNTGGVPF